MTGKNINVFPLTNSDSSGAELKVSPVDHNKSYVSDRNSKIFSKEEILRIEKEWRSKNERETFDRFI